MSELNLNRLYNPNGKQLGVLISGLSGSGKTTAAISSLQKAIKSKEFGENHKFVVVDPKHQGGDWDLLADPISDMKKFRKSIRTERVSLYYPTLEGLEREVDSIVNYLFDLANSSEASFTFVLDEASALIQGNKIPDGLKRVAVQGRAKRIKPVFISQRPIMNRWTDANLSSALFFRILTVDSDVMKRRWGVDFDSMSDNLNSKPYSFVFMDLETGNLNLMDPLPLPKPRPPKKKGTLTRLFKL